MRRAVLVVLGGLPATGKSTVAAELNTGGAFAYVRIDTIEQALRDSGELAAGGPVVAGYAVGYAVARDLLRGGHDALVECVNPLAITREAWRAVARDAGAGCVEVELICGDPAEHRRRAEQRTVDIAGLPLPGWDAIEARDYEPWPHADLRIDTAVTAPADAAAQVRTAVERVRTPGSSPRA